MSEKSHLKTLVAGLTLGVCALAPNVYASTWMPIDDNGASLVVPVPALTNVAIDATQFGTTAIVKLNDIGVTSAVYYQLQQFNGSVYQTVGDWLCQDAATLNNNSNELTFTLSEGQYKISMAATMLNDQCDVAGYKAGALISSIVYQPTTSTIVNNHAPSGTIAAYDPGSLELVGTAIDNDAANGLTHFKLLANDIEIANSKTDSYLATQLSTLNNIYRVRNFDTLLGNNSIDLNTAISLTLKALDVDSHPESYQTVATATIPYFHNQAPVAANDTVTTAEDTPVTFYPMGNDTDVNNDVMRVTKFTQPAQGTVAYDGLFTMTYTPAANHSGQVYFDYEISDGELLGGARVYLTTNSQNDIPVAVNDTVATNEDTATQIDVLANDYDVDHPSTPQMTINAVTQGNIGAVTLSNNIVRYTPNANACGTDSFNYTISDPAATTANATVNVTVNCVNDQPVAIDDAIATAEDTPVSIAVLTNDTDTEGTTLSVTSTTTPSKGSVAINNNVITYTPNANATGVDSLVYHISDGELTSSAKVHLMINPVNDAPITVADSISLPEDSALSGFDVLANDSDVDSNTSLSLVSASGTQSGSVSISNNKIDYTPNADFCGSDTFSYQVSDGTSTASGSATLTINCVDDAPIAVTDTVQVNSDAAHAISVLSNDRDIDSANLIVDSVSQGSNGAVTFTAQSVSYTRTPGSCQNDSFNYTVSDGVNPSQSGLVEVICSTPVNPPADATILPVYIAAGAGVDTSYQPTGRDITVTYPNVDNATYYQYQTRLLNESDFTTLYSGSSTRYTHTAAPGTYRIRYRGCNDGGCGNYSGERQIAVFSTPGEVRDLTATSAIQHEAMTLNWRWPSGIMSVGYRYIITRNGQMTHNAVTNNGGGDYSFVDTPTTAGTNRYQITACNPLDFCGTTKTANIEVTAAVALPLEPATKPKVGVSQNVDNQFQPMAIARTITMAPVFNASQYDVQINGATISNGTSLTYNHTFANTGIHYVSYRACNATGCSPFSDQRQVEVYGTPAKVADLTANKAEVPVGESVTLSWTKPSQMVSAGSYVLTRNGTTLNAQNIATSNNRLSFVDTPPASDSHTYTLTACNPSEGSSTFCSEQASLVLYKNNAPVAGNGNWSLNEDQTINLNLNTLASDVDAGSTLTITPVFVALPKHGQLVADAGNPGHYNYTPDANFSGSDSFDFRVKDNRGAWSDSNGTVSLTINPVDDAPLISITAPADGQEIAATSLFNATATVTDDGSVSKVEFKLDEGYWVTATLSGLTYTAGLNNLTSGAHVLTVRATDNTAQQSIASANFTAVVYPTPVLSRVSEPKILDYAVAWSTVEESTSYVLEERKDDGNWITIYDGIFPSMVFQKQALANYDYRVKACKASGCGEASTILPAMRLKNTYITSDILGSPILRSKEDGSDEKAIYYYPFGKQQDKH